MENVPLQPPNPEQNQRREITVTVRQNSAALGLARETGFIDPVTFSEDLHNQMIIRDTDTGVLKRALETTDPEQSEAIIEDLQARGILSKDPDEEGRFKRLEQVGDSQGKDAERGRAVRALGALTMPKSRSETTKQLVESTGSNLVSWQLLKIQRAKQARAKADSTTKANRESALTNMAWERGRKWILQIDPGEQPEPTGSIVLDSSGNSIDVAAILAERVKNRPERVKQPGHKDIAELVKQRVISPEEGRAMLLGGDAPKITASESSDTTESRQADTNDKRSGQSTPRTEDAVERTDIFNYGMENLREIDNLIGTAIADYLREHGDKVADDQQVEDKKQIRRRIILDYVGPYATDEEVSSIQKKIRERLRDE